VKYVYGTNYGNGYNGVYGAHLLTGTHPLPARDRERL